jgi:hypothetical protein
MSLAYRDDVRFRGKTGSSLPTAKVTRLKLLASSSWPGAQREKPAMTTDERLKLQKELIAARDRQASDGKARKGAVPAQPVKH